MIKIRIRFWCEIAKINSSTSEVKSHKFLCIQYEYSRYRVLFRNFVLFEHRPYLLIISSWPSCPLPLIPPSDCPFPKKKNLKKWSKRKRARNRCRYPALYIYSVLNNTYRNRLFSTVCIYTYWIAGVPAHILQTRHGHYKRKKNTEGQQQETCQTNKQALNFVSLSRLLSYYLFTNGLLTHLLTT